MQGKRGFFALPRLLLVALATLFAAATVLYSAIWMYYVRWEPKALIGIDTEYSPATRAFPVQRVREGTGAERAGLQPGDRILAINGRPLDTLNPYFDAVSRAQPGDVVELTLVRPGAAALFVLPVVLSPRPAGKSELTPAQTVALELIWSFPVLFLVVGLGVLFLRLEDRNAWLLALLFGTFIAGAPLLEVEGAIHPTLRGFALAYKVTFEGLCAAIFYYFFAVFPVSSPIDRRLPWLKRVLLLAAAAVVLPLGLWALLAGSSQPLRVFADQVGEKLIYPLLNGYIFGVYGLGLVSLVWNGLRAPTAEARRKIRVIVWGTVVGVTPFLVLAAAANYARKPFYGFPFWVWAPTVLVMFLVPLSFAYAVVKHRVLEIPLLLKRSARYLLVQRGFTLLTILESVAATLVFVFVFSHFVQPQLEFALPVGVGFGVAFGLLLAWAGSHLEKRVTERIDRAFFRGAYDARQILQELAEKTRTVSNGQELAALLQYHLIQALQPRTLVVYLRTGDTQLVAERGRVLPGLESISASHPVLEELARRGQPWLVPPPEAKEASDLSLLSPLSPECLVPILARDGRLAGLVVLGPRLSEEPYSGEDRRLLASVASQAGIALESVRLAEQMAERMEAERRAAFEIKVAKQVQDKLLPQKAPPLATLEYAGACIQARTVGGDYYDFLDLGSGRVGLVLADIAGKGISAALLMANLQANLRSQYAVALDDLPRLLHSVNRLFYDSTAPSHYATFFFALYDDARRRLRYANCGHIPPLLLRGDARVDRLTATATVLGLFEEWESTIGEVQLAPGDTLVIFSDGITEAMSDAGEEFGVARLLDTLRANSHLTVPALLSAIVTTVQQFSGRKQEDDLTLVVARPR
ncbi:MAG: SpoIIE family protein phosphatase [Terriglobia bacterium]